MTLKTCSTCRKPQPLSVFNKCKTGKNGLHPSCRSCLSEKMRQWRAANPERAVTSRRNHYETNKERVLAQAAIWRASNKELERATRAAHYQRNKKKNAEVTKAYRLANPELYAEAAAQRRAAKKQATPIWADRSKILALYAEARRLTEETGIVHEVDHIYPLQSKYMCGLHVETNLQILQRSPNRSKSNHRWPGMEWCVL